MSRLNEIEPVPITSMLQRNWGADAPPFIAGILVAAPAFVLSPPLKYVVLVSAVLTGVGIDFALSRLRQKWRIADATTPPSEFPEPIKFDPAQRADLWRYLTEEPEVRSLVLFSYGTCVVSTDDSADPTIDAKKLISEFGHPIPGTSSADTLVYDLPDSGDFVVRGTHPNILTHVRRVLIAPNIPDEQLHAAASWIGRDFLSLDAFSQKVVSVVDLASDHT